MGRNVQTGRRSFAAVQQPVSQRTRGRPGSGVLASISSASARSAASLAAQGGGYRAWCLQPTRRLVADHVSPIDQRPDLALERSDVVPACVACNVRRRRNGKLPDLTQIRPVLTLGDEMAEIFGNEGDRVR